MAENISVQTTQTQTAEQTLEGGTRNTSAEGREEDAGADVSYPLPSFCLKLVKASSSDFCVMLSHILTMFGEEDAFVNFVRYMP